MWVQFPPGSPKSSINMNEILEVLSEIRKIQNEVVCELHLELDNTCYVCNNFLMMSKISKDHVFPKSLGFKLGNNMMPAHGGCNNKKGNGKVALAEDGKEIDHTEAIKIAKLGWFKKDDPRLIKDFIYYLIKR